MLTLTGASTYSGSTTVSAGHLRVNNSSGSALGTGPVIVASGATLSGSGSFTGALQLAGTLSPGNSPGLLTIGSGSVLEGTTLIEIGGTARGISYDAINVSGAGQLTLGGILDVVLYGGWTPSGSATFQLFQATSIGGSFAQVNLPTVGGYVWNTSRLETDGVLDLSAIPEPGAYATLAGLATLASVMLRRRPRVA
ncbi:MAG: autotransporter-associated beta strand repeat-containing protein [Opitutaceae bacterium]|nr:autotransporter-associated beta strand repeat-containing protein [Opitutaceae bacterium]